ncbi:MAG: Calx-beta domain-containing protein [Isosphaeraceae bacterium]
MPIDLDPLGLKGKFGALGVVLATNFVRIDPVDAVLVDAEGRRLGYTAATGPLTEIPGSVYLGDADGLGFTLGDVAGPLSFQVSGATSGSVARAIVFAGNLVGEATVTGPNEPGQVVTPPFVWSPAPGTGGGSSSHPGNFSFRDSVVTTLEASGALTLTIDRLGGTDGDARVTLQVVGGTATAGADYSVTLVEIDFPAGISSRSVTLPIRPDTLAEGVETIVFGLSSPTAGAGLGATTTATARILDGPPNVRWSAFVRQGRQPALVEIAFNAPVAKAAALDLRQYRIVEAGRDGKFGTKDDRRVRISRSGMTDDGLILVLEVAKPAGLKPIRVEIRPSRPADGSGQSLDGNGDGRPGGTYSVRLVPKVYKPTKKPKGHQN